MRACRIEGSALCAEISQIYPKSFILSIRTFDLYKFVGFLVRRTTEFHFEGSALCAEISQIYPKSFILSIRTFDLLSMLKSKYFDHYF